MKLILRFIVVLIGGLTSRVSALTIEDFRNLEDFFYQDQIANIVTRGQYQCTVPLADAAYAFAMRETSNCTKGIGWTNNCWSMVRGGKKPRPYEYYSGILNSPGDYFDGTHGVRYNRYATQELGALSFMYRWYYLYGCKLTLKNIARYKCGTTVADCPGAKGYLKDIQFFLDSIK